jgi:hypothetical protein
MPIKPKALENLLQNKFGFLPAKGHSSDHRWYELQLPGIPKILTKVSHSREPINTNLEGKIARQLRVRKPYYEGMMACTNSRDAYYQLVTEDPFPPFDIHY